jgi:hypothetical protein
VAERPTLVIEVLPEAVQLGELLAGLAVRGGYGIYVVPGFGSDTIVRIDPGAFTSATPQRHHSKDVILSMLPVA